MTTVVQQNENKKNSSKTAPLPQTPLKLTPENYYSHETDWQYMSFSLFKDFEQCEARTLAKLKEDWQPTSSPVPLLVGNYVHSYFESAESHQSFVNENRKEVMTRSTKSSPDGHLRAEFKVADSMIKTLNDDNMFNYFYKPGKKEVIVTGKIDGYWWKGKIDSLMLEQSYFCDLKTVDDIHKGHWNVDEHRYVCEVNFGPCYIGFCDQYNRKRKFLKSIEAHRCCKICCKIVAFEDTRHFIRSAGLFGPLNFNL